MNMQHEAAAVGCRMQDKGCRISDAASYGQRVAGGTSLSALLRRLRHLNHMDIVNGTTLSGMCHMQCGMVAALHAFTITNKCIRYTGRKR